MEPSKEKTGGEPVRVTAGKVVHIRTKHGAVTVIAPPQRPFRWLLSRPVLYLLFVAVLLVILQSMLNRSAGPADVAPYVFIPPPPPTAGPVLGLRAIPLVGLKEVEPPLIPSTARLAAGSAGAQAAQLAFSQASRLPLEVENSIGMRFRLIPPGTFIMGSPLAEKGRWEGEYEHPLTLYRPFYISVCEVTQEQWCRIMPVNRSYFRYTREQVPAHVANPEVQAIAEKELKESVLRPAEEMTWHEAVEFGQRLAEKEKVGEKTYRLPFETEWEYACRAGTRSAYCFGDDARALPYYADYAENAARHPEPAGRRLPNAFGLHDMHGNVWEWCLDRFTCYPRPPGVKLSKEMEEYYYRFSECRVIRGGNWGTLAENCRSAERTRLGPLSHGNMLGFRLVRDIPEYKGAGLPAEFSIPDDTPPAAPPEK